MFGAVACVDSSGRRPMVGWRWKAVVEGFKAVVAVGRLNACRGGGRGLKEGQAVFIELEFD